MALGLCEKADCDRLGDGIARGWLAGVRVAGEHCEGSDTSAATFRDCLKDRLQDSLFGSTEHAQVNGSRQIDRCSTMVFSLEELRMCSTKRHRGISGDVAFGSALRSGVG